jgi:hypothetical protein
LAPSQWDPLIATLSARYCTISLGGPLLGVVGILEERGRSNYLAMVKSLLDLVDIHPNEVVLEVGGGSGSLSARLPAGLQAPTRSSMSTSAPICSAKQRR